MNGVVVGLLLLLVHSALLNPWQKNSHSEVELDDRRELYRFQNKRQDGIRRVPDSRQRDMRKKQTEQMYPDEVEDDMVSVAIGPPPMRPKHFYERTSTTTIRNPTQPIIKQNAIPNFFTSLIKDVLNQLGKEFISRQVSEEFVFGQYVGNSMKNLTSELKIKMQHDILDLILKYQIANHDEKVIPRTEKGEKGPELRSVKKNETDEIYVDFGSLASIMSNPSQ